MGAGEVIVGKGWSEATSNPMDDIARACELARQPTKYCPEIFYVGIKLFAWMQLGYLLDPIIKALSEMKYHTLPRFTFRDHWNDCFGWLKKLREN